MDKKGITIGIMILTALTFSACQKEEPESLPPEETPAVDPLEEAREKLFREIGIDTEESEENTLKPEEELPVVLPLPPELPKTDADLWRD